MEWIKKHTDTVIVLGGILGAVIWMNGKFNDIRDDLHEIDKRLTKVETIIYIKCLVHSELAAQGEKNER